MVFIIHKHQNLMMSGTLILRKFLLQILFQHGTGLLGISFPSALMEKSLSPEPVFLSSLPSLLLMKMTQTPLTLLGTPYLERSTVWIIQRIWLSGKNLMMVLKESKNKPLSHMKMLHKVRGLSIE